MRRRAIASYATTYPRRPNHIFKALEAMVKDIINVAYERYEEWRTEKGSNGKAKQERETQISAGVEASNSCYASDAERRALPRKQRGAA